MGLVLVNSKGDVLMKQYKQEIRVNVETPQVKDRHGYIRKESVDY